MMLTRRMMIKAAGTAAAIAPIGVGAHGRSAALIVYDSRIPLSRLLASGSGDAIDIAPQHGRLWRDLRSSSPQGRVVGVTRWSDYVVVRGCLEARGKRVRAEVLRGDLIHWEMA
ncbi:MAG: hypothetical protein KGQ42_02985 [Alphaproteobacteria bacterium]|nr:hypothetical protein [Alphaproteobacteria bacterium]MDE2042356.1 hypothetical protein [Alphaproteobacteria bacterium]MDE2339556.1 hypothetical protein [Alphaproteobacteria bacterium]